jgi:hypothetical protein
MATGQGQSGGVFGWPDVPELGVDTWTSMSGVSPSSPLVGGRGGDYGSAGTNVTGMSRRVAVGSPDAAGSSGAPVRGHFSEVLNLSGNPIGWVLIAAIIYLGLAHVSLHGSLRGRAGKARASASAGAGSG